ncbi:hypothetical protein GLOTRDRAFT_98130, partial [Gloeophyllum trabeum ATCC 11539]
MVAFVCTAIHATIDEWSSGVLVPEDFSGSGWAATYDIHVGMLEDVRDTQPRRYHDHMHYLYKQATMSTRNAASIDTKQPNALSLMDLSEL